nr:MAG TPA: hypothetical protein [Caudoviricetes sp.]
MQRNVYLFNYSIIQFTIQKNQKRNSEWVWAKSNREAPLI